MKFIITESDLNSSIGKFLKLHGIKEDYSFGGVGYDNQKDSKYVRGAVYLYKNGDVFGYRHGYEFFYNYNKLSKTLTLDGYYPEINKLDFLKFFPSEVIINYFSDNLKDNLEKGIEKGYINL